MSDNTRVVSVKVVSVDGWKSFSAGWAGTTNNRVAMTRHWTREAQECTPGELAAEMITRVEGIETDASELTRTEISDRMLVFSIELTA